MTLMIGGPSIGAYCSGFYPLHNPVASFPKRPKPLVRSPAPDRSQETPAEDSPIFPAGSARGRLSFTGRESEEEHNRFNALFRRNSCDETQSEDGYETAQEEVASGGGSDAKETFGDFDFDIDIAPPVRHSGIFPNAKPYQPLLDALPLLSAHIEVEAGNLVFPTEEKALSLYGATQKETVEKLYQSLSQDPNIQYALPVETTENVTYQTLYADRAKETKATDEKLSSFFAGIDKKDTDHVIDAFFSLSGQGDDFWGGKIIKRIVGTVPQDDMPDFAKPILNSLSEKKNLKRLMGLYRFFMRGEFKKRFENVAMNKDKILKNIAFLQRMHKATETEGEFVSRVADHYKEKFASVEVKADIKDTDHTNVNNHFLDMFSNKEFLKVIYDILPALAESRNV